MAGVPDLQILQSPTALSHKLHEKSAKPALPSHRYAAQWRQRVIILACYIVMMVYITTIFPIIVVLGCAAAIKGGNMARMPVWVQTCAFAVWSPIQPIVMLVESKEE